MSYAATPKQAELLAYIKAEIAERGVAPTLEEMGEHVGVVKSGAHRMVRCLEERGLIRRLRYKRRAIEVVQQ